MKIALLHLSDIHIRDSSCSILNRAEKICSTVYTILPDVSAVVIVVTGDIAHGGKQSEYALATEFFDKLIACIRSRVPAGTLVYMIPVAGNHDGEFMRETRARKAVVQSVQAGDEIDDSVIQICTEPQQHYFEFEKHYLTDCVTHADPLWKQHEIKIGERIVAISAINASWLSQVPEEPGKLVFPVKRYNSVAKARADVRIALLHHPLNWYAQNTLHPLRDLFRAHFQIIMSGHEHTANSSLVSDELGESLMIEAPALWPHPGGDSKFSVVTLDLDSELFAKVEFVWEESRYVPTQGEAVWDSFIPVPKRKNEGFSLSDDVIRRLEDIGATFTHPNKERLVLSDIYVYPELTDLDSTEDSPTSVSAKILSNQIHKMGKVMLRGDDQFGKTALLHTLYQKYFNAGYIPVLLTGKEIVNATSEQFQRRINSAILEQYGKSAVNSYAQLSKESKIVLIDDLDRTGAQPEAIARALSYVDKHFQMAVVTVGERFELAELSSAKTVEESTKFAHYRFMGFGFKLRTDLITKWLTIDNSLGEADLQSRVHDAQTVIDAVIGKGLVPTTAFNVLVLLQSLEVTDKGALANAGMAQYYEFLIRRSLVQGKLKIDKFDEIFSYLSNLAWFFHNQKAKNLDEQELVAFNRDFSERILDTDFYPRIEFLLKCRVLMKTGSSYSFRYPYIRYFFVSKYIASNLEEDEAMKDIVLHSCRHLYLKENANIILFLTHHSPNKWIIREVAGVLSQLVQETLPLDIKRDTVLLNGWVSKTARVIVDATDVKKNREEQRRRDDEADGRPEHEPNVEVASLQHLDYIGQLNLLFKTSEILGQILKNRYGSLDKIFKEELMEELFNGPLRGINSFLEIVNHAPAALIQEISKKFCEKRPSLTPDEADKIAQKLIFITVGAYADSLIARQGEIIGSPALKETIDQVANKQENSTFKLVSIAAQLSYPGHAPLTSIDSYAEQMKDNVFGYRLLQGIVARHLYMFSLPYDERQRLADAVKISVKAQSSINLKSADVKKLHGNHQPMNSKNLFGKLQNSFLVRNKGVTEKVLAGTGKVDKFQKLSDGDS